jgi:hypothetical protein
MFLFLHDYPVFAFFIPITATRQVKEINPKRKSEGTMRLSVILYRQKNPDIRIEIRAANVALSPIWLPV